MERRRDSRSQIVLGPEVDVPSAPGYRRGGAQRQNLRGRVMDGTNATSRWGHPARQRGPALIGLVLLLVAACSASPAPTLGPSPTGPATSPEPASTEPSALPSAPTPTASPFPPASLEPSVEPTAPPTPSPGSTAAPTPTPTPQVQAFGSTDPISGARITFVDVGDPNGPTAPKRIMTLSWRTPTSAATQVRLYGVTKCPAPETSTGVDCVTAKTILPTAILSLIRNVPASQRSVSWTWTAWEDIGQAIAQGNREYFALFVTFTTGGVSRRFVLATSVTCSGCTY